MKCAFCPKPTKRPENRFCSLKCAYASRVGVPRPNRMKPRISKTCPVCKEKFLVGGGSGSVKKVCCSYECRSIQSRKNIDEHPEVSLWSSAWRRRSKEVRERDKHKCVFCGCADRRLSAHHLLPRKFGGAHNMSNLAAACDRCHSALDKTIDIMVRLNPKFDIQKWMKSFIGVL